MSLNVHQVMAPVLTLGPGRRLAVWVQGCTIGCEGCASQDTWDPSAGTVIDVPLFAAELSRQVRVRELTGITITGGEPMQQADAVADLVGAIRAGVPDSELDVLLFTGFTSTAAARHDRLWRMVDIAVCGPFQRNRRSTRPLVASENQQVIVRTALGAECWARVGSADGLEVHVDRDDISIAGIPGPGDLGVVEAAMKRSGIVVKELSWQR